MKIVFLSRYQNIVERGAEIFVSELTKRLSKEIIVDIFSGGKADSLGDVLKGKYDVVIPTNGRWQSLKMSLGRLIGGYKLVITGHSGRGWDDILNIFLAKPDVFVALTDYLARWAKNWAWGSKILKINNGIDCDKFNSDGEKILIDLPKPIILSVGALVWYKHHDKAIEAVSRMKKGSLLIVGKGPLEDKLRKLGEKNLKKRFMITSFKNKDMPKVYRSCDLFTLPSWDREAFGIVYLEALASGLGIVAPNDDSRKEIIGDGGILVDTNNSNLYTEALNKALGIDWRERSINQSAKFSWDKIAKQYNEVLRSLK